MFEIKQHSQFSQWFNTIEDRKTKAILAARIERLKLGLFGDVEPVGDSVSELRIHVGAGWRIYFIRHGDKIIVLLGGGTKRTQKNDIKTAKKLANELLE